MANYYKQNLHNINKKKVSISYVIREKEERYHRSGVNALQYDRNLERLYSAGRDSVIRIWDFSKTNQRQRVRRTSLDRGCNNNSINQRDGDDRCQHHDDHYLRSMEHHTDWVNDIALCRNGCNLISVSNDSTIKVWEAHQGLCKSTLKSHKDYASCIAYAKDRELAASAGFDRMIFLWDIQALTMLTATKNTLTTKPLEGCKSSIYSLAINQPGTLIASGSTEKAIRLWDPRSKQKLLKLRGHTDNVRSLLFSRDGSLLLSASSDGTVRLWSITQQRCISIIRVHDEGVWALQTNEAFSTVYSSGKDGKVYMTNLKDTSDTLLVCEESAPVLDMLFVDRSFNKGHEDRPSLWISTTDSTIKNWPLNLNDGANECRPYQVNDDGPETPLVSAPDVIIRGSPAAIKYHVLNDKRHILTQESDNSVNLYDVLKARKVQNLHPASSAFEAKRNLESEIKNRFEMVYVPNWFTVDLKTGLLCIHLDESECFAAWVAARDYGIARHSDCFDTETSASVQNSESDPKVNLGCLMLQAIFEHWLPSYDSYKGAETHRPPTASISQYQHLDSASLDGRNAYRDVRSDRPNSMVQKFGNYHFSIPDHIPVVLSDGGQTLLQFSVASTANSVEELALLELLPPWIFDVVVSKSTPKFIKLPFFLLPHANSGIKSLRKERLSASDMLQMRKVVEHICEKMISINEEDGFTSNQTTSNDHEQVNFSVDKVELFCNDQKLEPHLDLRTVKHFIWKSSGDLILHYMPIRN